MSVISERELPRHIQSFGSHQYFHAPNRMTDIQSEMWTNMQRVGIGVVNAVHTEHETCSATILMTDKFGNLTESPVIMERKLFLEEDKLISFQIFDECKGRYFTFVTLAK